MVRSYLEEDMLPISGIQHFAFCERQWALIHVENQWVDNLFTAEGKLLHERVDDPYFTESRGNVKIVRSVPLSSTTLGLYGIADVIEIHKTTGANRSLSYSIVEYKRGKPKPDDRDAVQLCAQAMCLEEMLKIEVSYGALYYGKTKHRHGVELNQTLRDRVKTMSEKMHILHRQGITPSAVKGKHCKNCSMEGICLPKLSGSKKKAEMYMASVLEEMIKE